MGEESETRTQTLDSSSEAIELRPRQETETEPTTDETSSDELNLRSVDETIKRATDSVLRRVEGLRSSSESARDGIRSKD